MANMITTDLLVNFLELVGLVITAYSVIVFFCALVSWILGVYPLFLKLGFARWTRKISIVADDGMYNALKADLVDTGVFRAKNIFQINHGSLSKIKESSLLLVHYQSFSEEEIKKMLSYKKHNAGMVIYFPEFSRQNQIPDEMMKLINNELFTLTVNFRGRLINDIVVMLLSTGYEKK